ncbi:phosphatidylcholine/phosphatidylserine synthase [Rhizobium mongolense]|uniref:CDP-alcohol phosphatidyltransferase family protein n=1 Tax=Rhizobium mongolense TaxID=57676 RepID=UPI0035578AC0
MRSTSLENRPRSMLVTLADVPNVVTLLGLCMSVVAVIKAINASYELSLVFALLAVAADWVDGWLARRIQTRTAQIEEMGANLDSFADLVSSAIYPMVFIICVGPNSVLHFLAAIFIACTGILRLSFFNVYGATTDGKVLGLPIAYNILAMAAIVVLAKWLGFQAIWPLVTSLYVIFAAANVSPFYFPREGSKVMPAVLAYIGIMCFLIYRAL